jgi:hypothetical protein
MITEINLSIILSFMKDTFKSWDREILQPFFFHNYKDKFFEFESIYTNRFYYGWSNTRPLIIYIEPKEDVRIDDQTFQHLIEELSTIYKGHFDEKYDDFYSTAPSAPGSMEQAQESFFIALKVSRWIKEYRKTAERKMMNFICLPVSNVYGVSPIVSRKIDLTNVGARQIHF